MDSGDAQAGTGSGDVAGFAETLAEDEDDARADGPERGELLPGDSLGRYIILGTLGSGGMGVVVAAYDPELDRKVALKLLLPRVDGRPDGARRARLLREAQALARLSHPNVVAVHDVGTHGDKVWIALEFVSGQTLTAWARERPRSWPEILAVLTDVARGVASAHASGLVHRDLKPDNVMIGSDGRVRVMDFGLAHGRSVAAAGPQTTTLVDAAGPPSGAEVLAIGSAATLAPDSPVPVPAAMVGSITLAPGLADRPPAPLSATTLGPDPADMPSAARVSAAMPAPDPSDMPMVAPVSAATLEHDPADRPASAAPGVGTGTRPDIAALELVLTQDGALLGTPGYMAPEQWRGETVGPPADQFGWSVMAWELLYGELPFAGATVAAVCSAIVGGRRRPPPRGSRVPAWVRRIVERGLAVDPAKRWPTMHELLAALERGRAGVRRRRVAIALAGVGACALGFLGFQHWDMSQRTATCEAEGAALAAVWNDDARARVRQAFVASEVPYAAATAERVFPWLDAGVAAWQTARTEACVRATVEQRWDPELLDRSLWCLADRRLELESTIGELLAPDNGVVRSAVWAASSLRPAAACLDEDRLRRTPALPLHARAAARTIHGELARVGSLRLAEKRDEGLRVATRAREQAAALPWPPLEAEARALAGLLLRDGGRYPEAEAEQSRAYFLASTAGAWEVAAKAAVELVFTVGYHGDRPADGRMWGQHAEMAIAHAGDRGGLRAAQLATNLGNLDLATGDIPAGRARFERALALSEAVVGGSHPNVAAILGNLGNIHLALGEYAEARAMYQRTLAIYEAVLAPDDSDVASLLNNLAVVHEHTGDFPGARALHERALAIRERALGPDHPLVANTCANLGTVLDELGDHAGARALHERALAIYEKTGGPDHPDVGFALINLAAAVEATGDPRQALAMLRRSLAITEKTHGPTHALAAAALVSIASLNLSLGSPADAGEAADRALAIRERWSGPDHPEVAQALVTRASVHLAEGQAKQALALLERAVTIYGAHDGEQADELAAHFELARALVAAGGDRARAVAEATVARDGYRALGASRAAPLAEVEAWLAGYTGGVK